jgi:hypothetical protein
MQRRICGLQEREYWLEACFLISHFGYDIFAFNVMGWTPLEEVTSSYSACFTWIVISKCSHSCLPGVFAAAINGTPQLYFSKERSYATYMYCPKNSISLSWV